MADKKYYWLKLKRDFFKRHDIQIIEAMPNGKDYVLFYLKLLLESVDHEGHLRFSNTIPYNEHMIATITNTNVDIVRSAMKMFCELHMAEMLDDETIYMTEVKNMVGSETDWAKKKRLYREKQALLEDNARTKKDNVRQELEKEIELELDIELDKEKDIGAKSTRFKPPTLPEVEKYCKERKNNVDPQRWYDFYQSKGWMVGKNKMKDWKAAVRTWEKDNKSKPYETDLQRRKRVLDEQIREAENGNDGGSEETSESDYKLLPGG